jgi:hypothetical protein
MVATTLTPVLRIELWHAVLLIGLWLLLPLGSIEPLALFLGGLFMGLNFVLLGVAIRYLLAPFAENRRVRTGVCLLLLKLALFLGALSLVFTRVEIDALSFAVGVSCLLLAIVAERGWAHVRRN